MLCFILRLTNKICEQAKNEIAHGRSLPQKYFGLFQMQIDPRSRYNYNS